MVPTLGYDLDQNIWPKQGQHFFKFKNIQYLNQDKKDHNKIKKIFCSFTFWFLLAQRVSKFLQIGKKILLIFNPLLVMTISNPLSQDARSLALGSIRFLRRAVVIFFNSGEWMMTEFFFLFSFLSPQIQKRLKPPQPPPLQPLQPLQPPPTTALFQRSVGMLGGFQSLNFAPICTITATCQRRNVT